MTVEPLLRVKAVKPGEDGWVTLLTSLVLVMTFQIIRFFVTALVYAFGDRFGQTLAAVPALVVFAAPLLAAQAGARLKPRWFLAITAGGLAVLRLLMQISRNIDTNLVLAGLAIPLALAGLVLAFSLTGSGRAFTPRQLVMGILLGLSLETGLHGAFLTWDYLWQPGLLPFLVALVVSGLALVAVWKVQAILPDQLSGGHSLRAILSAAGLGGFFMLEMLFFQNPAFIASSGLLPIEGGLVVVLAGSCLGIWAAAGFSRLGWPARLAGGAVLTGAALFLPNTTGLGLIALVLAGQSAAAGILACALAGYVNQGNHPGILRTSLAVTAGGLLFIILTILYYISTLVTLPFSYTVLPVIAAALFSLTAFTASHRAPAVELRLASLPLALLLIPLVLFFTRPTAVEAGSGADSEIRFLNYNIRQAINFQGWLDPEGLAQFIESQKPDIFVLQEVSRGWLIAGALDDAEWLARRLNMTYVYAPGHDYQFGNIIFSRLPVADWSFTRLPLLEVPLGRGLIRAEFRLEDGRTFTVINTHLSAYASDQARAPQVLKVLAAWDGAPLTIIAGDMNTHLEDSAIGLFRSAGFTSAQDVTGNSGLLTYPSVRPDERIDWIFGTPDIGFRDFSIAQITASDHLPLAVTLQLR